MLTLKLNCLGPLLRLFGAKVSEAVQPEVVANRSYAKVNKTCCVTEAPSIFDGSLAGRTSSCCFGRRNHVWNESTMRT
ncbi:unnamed protein product [Brassica rapa]|uniref:Secreted protein n=1 Tax=Brassica campestris TaxID=3711 RepID=A0A8D9G837_BRACM|nr:unnamed protein product [Brassica rapa]